MAVHVSTEISKPKFVGILALVAVIVVTGIVLASTYMKPASGGERVTTGQIITIESSTVQGDNTLWSFTTLSNKGNTWHIDLLISDEAVVLTPGTVIKTTGVLKQFSDFDLVCSLDSYEIISSP